MTRRSFPLLLCVAALALGATPGQVDAAPENPSIRNYPLDEYSVQTVPVSRDTVITVSFPGPITAIQGSRFTTGGGRQDLLQIDYNKGSYFLSLRTLERGARANLNVVWNHKTYVLDVVDSTEPVLSAIFVYGGVNKRAAVTPNRLLGMMDKAKSFPLLAANYPQAVADVEVAKPGTPTDYPQFVVTVDEVYRFSQADTLVFPAHLQEQDGGDRHLRAQPARYPRGRSGVHQRHQRRQRHHPAQRHRAGLHRHHRRTQRPERQESLLRGRFLSRAHSLALSHPQ